MEITSVNSFEDTSIAFSSKSTTKLKKAYLLFSIVSHPFVSATATMLTKAALFLHLPIKWMIKQTIFELFCGGETIEKSKSTIEELGQYGVGTILDYSVEGGKKEKSFEQTKEEILRTVSNAKKEKDIPFCVFKMTGIASFELLEKVSTGKELNEGQLISFKRVEDRVNEICSKGHELGIPILIDAEETWIQNAVDSIVNKMMSKYNGDTAVVFNTFQMYRKDAVTLLGNAIEEAQKKGYYLGAKLVRGAYMEKERDRAKDMGYESPICNTKEDTDKSYDTGLEMCVEQISSTHLLNGSHNDLSNYLLTTLMEKYKLKKNDNRIWFAQLYGMSDHISFNLAKAGYNVAKYVPYGPVRSVMPYLFRRAEENTSVAGQSGRELTLIKKELVRRRQLN